MSGTEVQACIEGLERFQADIDRIVTLYDGTGRMAPADRAHGQALLRDLKAALKDESERVTGRHASERANEVERGYYASKVRQASTEVGSIREIRTGRATLGTARVTLQLAMDSLRKALL